jgi:hypothetical protein
MPMKSQAQRAYLHIHHPDVAAEFEAAAPKGSKLPKHARHKRMRALKRRASAHSKA